MKICIVAANTGDRLISDMKTSAILPIVFRHPIKHNIIKDAYGNFTPIAYMLIEDIPAEYMQILHKCCIYFETYKTKLVDITSFPLIMVSRARVFDSNRMDYITVEYCSRINPLDITRCNGAIASNTIEFNLRHLKDGMDRVISNARTQPKYI